MQTGKLSEQSFSLKNRKIRHFHEISHSTIILKRNSQFPFSSLTMHLKKIQNFFPHISKVNSLLFLKWLTNCWINPCVCSFSAISIFSLKITAFKNSFDSVYTVPFVNICLLNILKWGLFGRAVSKKARKNSEKD